MTTKPRITNYWQLATDNWRLNTSIDRTKKLNYAKQTQFTECPNERKLCINNGLCQYTPPQPLQKQSQSNPIQTQSPSAIRNTRYEIRDTNPIQTQSPIAIRNTRYEIRDTNPNKPNLY